MNDDTDSNTGSETCELISVVTNPVTENEINEAPIIITSDSSDSNVAQPSSSSQSSTVQKKRRLEHSNKRKRVNSGLSSDEDILFEKAIAVMDQKNDELDHFGQYIASELRKITDESSRKFMKLKITAVLMGFASDIVPNRSNHAQQKTFDWSDGSHGFEEMTSGDIIDFQGIISI